MAPEFKSRGTGKGKLKIWEDAIVLMDRNGMLQKEIAKVVGSNKSSVSHFLKRRRGECRDCSQPARLHSDGRAKMLCEVCHERNNQDVLNRQRTPSGWADNCAKRHRHRARNYNKRFEVVTGIIQQTNITGPEILDLLYKCGSECALCGKDEGYPWEHVGKESGPELDHILCIGSCIAECREDWCRPQNLRLLCVGCHSREGERRIVDEEILTACIERALAKDRS